MFFYHRLILVVDFQESKIWESPSDPRWMPMALALPVGHTTAIMIYAILFDPQSTITSYYHRTMGVSRRRLFDIPGTIPEACSHSVIHTLMQPLLLVIASHLTQCAAARQVIPGRWAILLYQSLQAPNILGQTGQTGQTLLKWATK